MKPQQAAELLTLAALWGGSFLFMRIAAPELGPVWLIFFRVLIAGTVLLPLLFQRGLLGQLRVHLRPLAVVGLLNSALPFVLLAFASLSLPAGMTAILNSTAPFFGLLVAYGWLREPLTLSRIVGLLLGFAGVVALVGIGDGVVSDGFGPAVVTGLCAALMYAIAAPYIRLNLQGIPSLVFAAGTQLSAAACLAPFLPFTRPEALPSLGAMLALIGLALFSTTLAYILYFRLIQSVGSTRALTVTYLIPLFAMVWGAMFLGEAITVSMMIGGSLILLGTAIVNGLLKPG